MSAGAFLPLLKENDSDLCHLALQTLLNIVDEEWSQISEALEFIKTLSHDGAFPHQQLAAYLSSKVYYHLGDKDQALNLALESGANFDLKNRTQYNESLAWHCIDQYVKSQQNGGEFPLKKRQLVEDVINSSCHSGHHFSALGVSLDCKREDLVQSVLDQLPQRSLNQVLNFVYNVPKGHFRDSVLRLVITNKHINTEEWSQYVGVLVQLNEVGKVAQVLQDLLEGNHLLAYQIAVDLAENQRPYFIGQLISQLPVHEHLSEKRQKLITILSGELQRKAQLQFLKDNNQTDHHILNSIKTATDPKQSIPHGAALMAHAIMQTGTQDISFLKTNHEWATKCNYWLRFTTTATLGMVFKGCHERANEVLSTYLPGSSTNVFENGGALYALGLINQGTRNNDVVNKLTDAIRNQQLSKSEQVIHGACLGLGLTQFASEDNRTTDILRELLHKNESIYGEAAGLALGLVHAGSGNLAFAQELLTFSKNIEKEKIIRQLGTAIAAIVFGMEDKADDITSQMLADTEPFVRYGGCLALAMAYVGTASNKVIEKLLHQAVNDVADEVRRIAVISLAFVLFRNYEQTPKVMRLLILSYNPHIRYGTAMALGIACAGTMHQDAISMLEPMLGDNVDFVRQGALIAMSLVMMQANPNCEPKFEAFKKTISEMQAKKHETNLVKLGVYLSQGILDAGGRNLLVQMTSKQGFPKLEACIGMMVFTNYWFWFPFLPFFSLALSPAAVIGLNENLQIPKKFQILSNSKASVYGYPSHHKQEEKKVADKKSVQLSTTNRVRARQSRREAERAGLGESSIMSLRPGESQMSLEQQPSQQALNKHHSQVIQNPDAMKTEDPVVKKEEPSTTILYNPTRILEKQKKLIQYPTEQRYEPVFKDRKQGLIMLIDSEPNEQDEYIELFAKPRPAAAAAPVQTPPRADGYHQVVPEVEAPAEFEFEPEKQQ